MSTPESSIKRKVTTLLKQFGIYYFYPVTGGYGRSGVPDIVCCWRGIFIGIECKANGNKPTALQMKNLNAIAEQGGLTVLVDDKGLPEFVAQMHWWERNHLPRSGMLLEFTGEKPPE